MLKTASLLVQVPSAVINIVKYPCKNPLVNSALYLNFVLRLCSLDLHACDGQLTNKLCSQQLYTCFVLQLLATLISIKNKFALLGFTASAASASAG